MGYIRGLIGIFTEQSQIKREQRLIREEQRACEAEWSTFVDSFANSPNLDVLEMLSGKQAGHLINRRRGLNHWIIGLNVRIVNLKRRARMES